jgi:hypothetical protein
MINLCYGGGHLGFLIDIKIKKMVNNHPIHVQFVLFKILVLVSYKMLFYKVLWLNCYHEFPNDTKTDRA